MQEIVFPFMGGLGLFLIGMSLLSNGLVASGGGLMKQALAHFTGTPTKAFLSGVVVTMVAQSSTATTVTLIGFVSAGLISFAQAIGVLIGASLGNTATGWIVSTLGLKVNLGFYALPLIGVGALLKLLGRGRPAELGLALAGLGMLFVGLQTLQTGMQGLSTVFDLAQLPSGGLSARFAIMLVGLLLTAVLQSSTAAIATTLTALHTHTITFDQAASLVVGAAIGTTLTGALVTIGGTLYAKRTAVAYILFNAIAGLLAMTLLPVFFWVIEWLERHANLGADAVALAAFHSLFIGVGVLLFMPWLPQFARLVERLLPDRGGDETLGLDASVHSVPEVALAASQRALERLTLKLLGCYEAILTGQTESGGTRDELTTLGVRLDEAYRFASRIELHPDDPVRTGERIAQLHALDHLMRFRLRLLDLLQAEVDLRNPPYDWSNEPCERLLTRAREGLVHRALALQLPDLQQMASRLATLARSQRHALLVAPHEGERSAQALLAQADTYRWIERTGHHIWRVCQHLVEAQDPATRPAQTLPASQASAPGA